MRDSLHTAQVVGVTTGSDSASDVMANSLSMPMVQEPSIVLIDVENLDTIHSPTKNVLLDAEGWEDTPTKSGLTFVKIVGSLSDLLLILLGSTMCLGIGLLSYSLLQGVKSVGKIFLSRPSLVNGDLP
jgi:hypothetical protein